jgi:hypothetical protein
MSAGTPTPQLNEIITTPTHYRAEDSTDGRFYVDGKLLGGVLTFEIVAELPGNVRGAVSGKQLLAAMINYFGLANIQKIKAIWTDVPGLDTNLKQFNHWTGVGNLSEVEAARKTWTGQRATLDYQFVAVHVQMADPPIPGSYEDVIVIFSR